MTRYLDNSNPETWTAQDYKDLMNGTAKPMWKVYADKEWRAPACIYPNRMLKRHWLETIQELTESDDTQLESTDWSEFSCDVNYWANLISNNVW